MKPSCIAVASLLIGVAASGCGGRSGLKLGDGGVFAGTTDGSQDGRLGDGGRLPDGGFGGDARFGADVPPGTEAGMIGDGGTMAALAAISVAPAARAAGVGTTATFTATGRYSNGTTRDLSTTATWSSSATMV